MLKLATHAQQYIFFYWNFLQAYPLNATIEKFTYLP